jgi:thioredoxin-related protein
MKTSITVVLFAFLFANVNVSAQTAEKVKWYTIEEAIQLNAKTPKKIMIDIYTDWCGWCKKMDKDTFNEPEIARYINANYYPVKFDAESSASVVFAGKTFEGSNMAGGRKSPHQLAVAFFNGQSIGYPAIAYLTEKLEIIGTVPGYKTPQQIEPLLHYVAESKYQSEAFDKYSASFVSQIKKNASAQNL